MSWGAQNRSEDAKTPSAGRAMSENPELDRCPIQPYEVSADKSASISNQAGHRVPLTYLCVAPPGWDRQPSLCRGTADSLPRLALARNRRLYLPKTALAALASLYPFPVTVPEDP
jgi:hypothetical protein